MLRVLVPTANYGAAFVTPRAPQRSAVVLRRPPVDLRRAWRPLEGLALWDPRERFDLVHCYNTVPVTGRPFVVTYESALPRTYGPAAGPARELLRRRLLRDNCRGVVALSDYAVRRSRGHNAGWAGQAAVEARTQVVPPNLPLRRTEPRRWAGGPVRLLFVGRQWARKGGVVAVRVARRARERGIPVEVTLVSALVDGAAVYTDAPEPGRYAADRRLLDAPGVTVHRGLPNDEVLRLMAESTFTLLPTVHDTYGFSVLEGMSVGTPAIVTGTAALPEVVQDGVNGFVLDLPVDATGDWVHLHDRSWERLDALFDSLAEQLLARLAAFCDEPEQFERLSAGAIARIAGHHESRAVGARLEALYRDAAG